MRAVPDKVRRAIVALEAALEAAEAARAKLEWARSRADGVDVSIGEAVAAGAEFVKWIDDAAFSLRVDYELVGARLVRDNHRGIVIQR